MASDAPAFEIGFVLAGAVSAGCYSAGVMDFFIEALDEYYAARKEPGWDGPRHDVRVPVLAGASAGGMVAGMAGLHMFRDFDHVRPGVPPPPKARNRLYSSWVSDISIERLLETSDLGDDATGVRSALCSQVLDDILEAAFDIEGEPRTRLWVGRPATRDPALRILLTLTNLRGVPYSFDLKGHAGTDTFAMLNHADVGAFAIGRGSEGTHLDVDRTDEDEWDFFKKAALATGAFPIGLVPRELECPAGHFVADGVVGSVDATGKFAVTMPDSIFPSGEPFRFWAVDGGMIDNEPLELARRILFEHDAEATSPHGENARGAMVLVAPFPHARHSERDPVDGTLRTVLPAMLSALRNQARFKPEELSGARDLSDFSRFLISPERPLADGSAPEHAIASGALGGFSGFLHESFRRHDYLLGRRNAQAFLRWNFGLPASHPLFEGRDFDPKWLVRDAGSATGTVQVGGDLGLDPKRFALRKGEEATQVGYPIIPLTERMREPIDIGAGDVPRPSREMLGPLEAAIHDRVQKLVEVLVDRDLQSNEHGFGTANWFVRQGAKLFGTDAVHRKATGAVADALAALAKSFP